MIKGELFGIYAKTCQLDVTITEIRVKLRRRYTWLSKAISLMVLILTFDLFKLSFDLYINPIARNPHSFP